MKADLMRLGDFTVINTIDSQNTVLFFKIYLITKKNRIILQKKKDLQNFAKIKTKMKKKIYKIIIRAFFS